MGIIFLLKLIYLFHMLSVGHCQTYNDTRTIHEIILNFYENDYKPLTGIIPLEDQSSAMLVVLTMHLYSVDGFDAVTGQAEISGSIYMEWSDETMAASIGNFDFPFNEEGFSVRLPPGSVWTPSVRLTNAVDTVKHVGDDAYKVRYHVYDGRMMWQPKVIMKAACKPDIKFYPFDIQECSFVYTTWGYTISEIQLDSAQSDWYLCDYTPNAVWALLETRAEYYEIDEQSYMRFVFRIERQPLYFIVNVVFPILLLSVLNGFVFLLPADSGERVGFSLTCFLAFVFMLQTVLDFLPHTADPMSLFCLYVIIMMVTSICACIMTVLNLRLYHKPESDKVPGFLRKFVRCLSCSTRCKRSARNTTLPDIESTDVKGSHKREKFSKIPSRNSVVPDEVNHEECAEEDKVTWSDVARVLDNFLFLVFIGGQATISFFFLIPLATGPS